MSPLFPQRFAIDVPGHAITVGDLVFDLLFRAFQDDAVDGFIRQFIRKATLALSKEGAQTKTQALVLLARTVAVGTEPLEKARKLFSRYFLFRLWFGNRNGPGSVGGGKRGKQKQKGGKKKKKKIL